MRQIWITAAGAPGLPEYYRAHGARQGNMQSACNMSIAQAQAIVAAYDGTAPAAEPAPRVRRRVAL